LEGWSEKKETLDLVGEEERAAQGVKKKKGKKLMGWVLLSKKKRGERKGKNTKPIKKGEGLGQSRDIQKERPKKGIRLGSTAP